MQPTRALPDKDRTLVADKPRIKACDKARMLADPAWCSVLGVAAIVIGAALGFGI